jgi:hypothetical protein
VRSPPSARVRGGRGGRGGVVVDEPSGDSAALEVERCER